MTQFAALSSQITFPAGVGLPGRVFASGEPFWISDVVKDTNFPRARAAEQLGLHGAFAFPVRRMVILMANGLSVNDLHWVIS